MRPVGRGFGGAEVEAGDRFGRGAVGERAQGVEEQARAARQGLGAQVG